jgi:hypothetical protein
VPRRDDALVISHSWEAFEWLFQHHTCEVQEIREGEIFQVETQVPGPQVSRQLIGTQVMVCRFLGRRETATVASIVVDLPKKRITTHMPFPRGWVD